MCAHFHLSAIPEPLEKKKLTYFRVKCDNKCGLSRFFLLKYHIVFSEILRLTYLKLRIFYENIQLRMGLYFHENVHILKIIHIKSLFLAKDRAFFLL